MRFLLRFLSLVSLAAATIAGTIDSIQSVAASLVVITSFGDSWKSVSPSTFAKWSPLFSQAGKPHFYDSAAQWVLLQPAFAVLLAVSLFLWMLGYRKVSISPGLAT